jgi:hypothetical protein
LPERPGLLLLVVSLDGSTLVIGMVGGTVVLWSTTQRRRLRTLR